MGADDAADRAEGFLRPSLEILSLLLGDPEGIARAVIPSEASADLKVRRVPGQKVAVVAAQVRRFFLEQMPDSVDSELTVDEETGQEPYVTPEGDELAAGRPSFSRGRWARDRPAGRPLARERREHRHREAAQRCGDDRPPVETGQAAKTLKRRKPLNSQKPLNSRSP